MCPPTNRCTCMGHVVPGVHHVVACCDKPHVTEEQARERDKWVRKEWDAEFNGIPIDSPDNPTEH
jgi:hypothetical protein